MQHRLVASAAIVGLILAGCDSPQPAPTGEDAAVDVAAAEPAEAAAPEASPSAALPAGVGLFVLNAVGYMPMSQYRCQGLALNLAGDNNPALHPLVRNTDSLLINHVSTGTPMITWMTNLHPAAGPSAEYNENAMFGDAGLGTFPAELEFVSDGVFKVLLTNVPAGFHALVIQGDGTGCNGYPIQMN